MDIFLDNFVEGTGKIEDCVLFTGRVSGFDIKAMRENVQCFLKVLFDLLDFFGGLLWRFKERVIALFELRLVFGFALFSLFDWSILEG